MIELVPVSKYGEYIEVHPSTLAAHKAVGWRECERREVGDEAAEGSARLGIAEMRDALAAKGVPITDGARKADVRALYEANC